MRSSIIRAWSWVHTWSSLISTLFLLMLCITGLPLVFTQSEEAPFVDPAEADPDRGIFRVWSSSGELYQLRSPYVLTPAAEAARADWEPYTDQLALRCVAPGMPNAILNPYPIEIIDRGDQILIRIEEWEAVRTVDMVSETIPEDASGSLLGYSVGRWEDDRTLVVETGRVDFPYLDDAGTPMSNDARMIERFSLSQDGNELDYEIAVTDSENLVEPVVWVAAWTWIPGNIIRPYECEVE